MNRINFFIVLLAILFNIATPVYANVTNILNITNPQIQFNYDVANNPIYSYGSKLIVSNFSKTEEYLILPDGQLEFVSYFDVSSEYVQVSGDRLIIPNREPARGFFLFDLSVTPMNLITYVDLWGIVNLGRYWKDNTFYDDNNIYIHCQFLNRIHLINKATGVYERYIAGIANYAFTYKTGDIFLQVLRITGGLALQLHTQREDETFELISSMVRHDFGTDWTQIDVVDTKIIISTWTHLFITDISNPSNPVIVFSMPLSRNLISFYYTDDFLYTFDWNHNLMVYTRNNVGNYQLIHTQRIHGITMGISPHSLHFVEPYLFLNGEVALYVFDTESGYDIVNRHGTVAYIPLISVSDDDMYYVEVDVFNTTQKIYSVLDHRLIATLNYTHLSTAHYLPAWPTEFFDFRIIDDRLYVSTVINEICYFDIFQLADQEAILINSIEVGNTDRHFYLNIISNRVFLGNPLTNMTSVYELAEDNLDFLTSFSGRIQHPLATQPTSFILNTHGGSLLVRDLYMPSNILYQRQINNLTSPTVRIDYFDDNHFLSFVNETGNSSFIHFIDISNNTYSLVGSLFEKFLTPLNWIIRAYVNDHFAPNISEFYTIREGELHLLYTLNYGNRSTTFNFTYFFPERSKKVLATSGGIWVYDVEFETVSDGDVVVEVQPVQLYSNFPNPFNPDTTIEFSIGAISTSPAKYGHEDMSATAKGQLEIATLTHVSITIYNIKGQRVRNLVDGVYETGHHSVVWDGTDDNGRFVGSGVYLYRIDAGEFSATRKMVLIK
jgi:hypothetical protein